MIGMVLVTHGRLAEELRSAMEHVVGPQRHCSCVCVGAEDDMEQRRGEIARCLDTCDTGDGVVLLTDMLGGTPSNLAMSVLEKKSTHQTEVLTGINLPLLVKFAKVRGSHTLESAVSCAQDAGRKYIKTGSSCSAANGVEDFAIKKPGACG